VTGKTATHTFDTQRRLVGLRLGRYVMGPRLGAGGTASVYLAREALDDGQGRIVGLKVIHDHLLEEADFVRMFIDEANLAQRMSHPNVVRVFEFGKEGESLFLAMEYLHGQPLSRLFERLAEQNQRLPFDLVMWVGARAADGLHHAHQLKGDDGQPLVVIHRDVSPQNVFVTYDGQVKLIDFGIAKAEGRLAKTTLGRIKGKFSYMAPEQVLGSDFDQRADLFALGATLYELTVGVRLFAGDDQTDTLQKLLFEKIPDPAERAPDVPSELSAIIRKALAPEPEGRYSTAAEISRDLDALLATRGVPNGQPALARLMTTLFATEMRDRVKTIEQLRGFRLPGEPDPRNSSVRLAADTRAPDDLSAVRAAEVPAKRRLPWVAIAGVGVLATAAIILGVSLSSGPRTDDPVVVPPVPPSSAVTFDIQVQPPVKATIKVDGNLVGDPPRAIVDRNGKHVMVVVEAQGYETARVEAVADRDQLVVVPLVRVAPPAVSSAVAEGSARKPGSKSPGGKPTGTAPKSTSTGSLVTEYPF
jgi:serine/threonine-protein kinase